MVKAPRHDGSQGAVWIISKARGLAFWLRGQFADARGAHRFHNQMTARDKAKNGLTKALSGCAARSNFARNRIADRYGFAPGAIHTVHDGAHTVFLLTRDDAHDVHDLAAKLRSSLENAARHGEYGERASTTVR